MKKTAAAAPRITTPPIDNHITGKNDFLELPFFLFASCVTVTFVVSLARVVVITGSSVMNVVTVGASSACGNIIDPSERLESPFLMVIPFTSPVVTSLVRLTFMSDTVSGINASNFVPLLKSV